MPEIPLKISRAIICKKTREIRHNNFMGQGESALAILRSALLCLRGSRTPRRRNLDIKDSDLEIERDQARTSLDSAAIDTLLLNYWDAHGNFNFFLKFIDSFLFYYH